MDNKEDSGLKNTTGGEDSGLEKEGREGDSGLNKGKTQQKDIKKDSGPEYIKRDSGLIDIETDSGLKDIKSVGNLNDIKVDSGLKDIKKDSGPTNNTETPDLKMAQEGGERQKNDYTRNNIPIPYIEDFQCFDTWVDTVRAWAETTDLPKRKQGYALACEIPISSKRYGASLREDLYKEVKPSSLTNNEGGLEEVITFLKSRIWQDSDEELYKTYNDIKTIRRKKNQTVNEYIIEYDKMLQKAKQMKLNNPNDKVLAMDLMITADLSSTEFMLIRTVADVTTEDGKRYATIKQKMREIFGKLDNTNNEAALLTQSNKEDDIQKQQEEIFLSKGWKPPKHNKRYQNNGQNRYQNQNRSGNNRSNNSAAADNDNKTTFKKRQNPLGPNGKPLRCKRCDATTHFLQDCPDSYENLTKNKNKKFQALLVDKNTDERKEVLLEYVSSTESEQDQDQEENAFCTVYCADNQQDLNTFTAEALNKGALDTCATASVAGEKWMKVYLKAIPNDMRDKISGPLKTTKQFIFGNQGKLKAIAKYILPVRIGGEDNTIEVDIITSDIPLLISKGDMKKLGIALDMKNDRGYINGKPMTLNTTTAGHYVIDLLGNPEDFKEVNLTELQDDNKKKQMKLLTKIHLQFGHRSKKQFVTILKEAGQWKDEFSCMIDKIMDKCEGCQIRKKTPDRPAVAPPMASDFGEVLGLDLKVWDKNKNIYILYMIDIFTRYQVATIIRNKEPDTIVKALTTKWFPIFGKVNKIITDNGGEFCNEDMTEVASALDIIHLTTGANSGWQNGTVERNHGTTDGVALAVHHEFPNMSLEMVLAWAVTAVNSMSSVRGFSPHQLVFGRQIKLPNILEDPPAAWEEPEKSKTLLDTLQALHATRVAYTKNERCERIKRALRAKIRIADTVYERGDIVYYKKESEERWRGPAKVIFQDGKVIFIRVGSIYCRVSANRICKASDGLAKDILEKEKAAEQATEGDTKTQDEVQNIKTRRNMREDGVDHGIETSEPAKDKEDQLPVPNQDSLRIEENREQDNETSEVDANTEELLHDVENQGDNRISNDNDQRQVGGRKRRKVYQKPEAELNEDGTITNAAQVLKRNDRIEILENGKWEKGIVLGHGGKVGGKHAGWYNIQLDNGQVFHDEMSKREIRYETNNEETNNKEDEIMMVMKLDNGKTIEIKPREQRKIRYENKEETDAKLVTEEILAVMLPAEQRESPAAMAAKQIELDKLKAFDTYEVVEDQGQDRITTTWVLTEKGDEVRARLTARGFQEDGDFPTDSPTVQKHSIRLLLALAVKYGWDISTTDITSAFLQGNPLDRDVYIKPPKEANQPGKLYKLNKCLYGLKDASRQWYFKVLNKLKALGFQKAFCDKGVFFLIKDNKLIGFVALHVDDFLHAGNKFFVEVIMPQVLAAFKVGKSETRNFLYTGIQINQEPDCIKIDQEKYTKNVQIPKIDLHDLKDKKREMNQDELTLLRQLTGMVNWAQRSTRPDLSFETIELSTKFKGGKVEDLIQAKNVAARLKKLNVTVKTANIGNYNDCQVWVFTDAAFRNLNNSTDSCGGYFMLIVNTKNGNCAPIEWKSGKIKRKVNSTLGAETLSLYSGIDAALAIKMMLKEMTNGEADLIVKAITDNKSAKVAVYSESEVNERMLRADIAMIKDMIEDGRLSEVKWVEGKKMLADILTKKSVNKIPIMEVLENGRIPKDLLQLINN